MKTPPLGRLPLTPRETEVLHLVMHGYRNKVIASYLGISLQTTKNHVYHLLAKYGVRSRLELTLMVRTNGNLPVGKQNREASPPGDDGIPASPLTTRQLEILNYIRQGLRNNEIAIKLGITEATVKAHVKFTMRKLNVSSRTEAVVVALERRLIKLD